MTHTNASLLALCSLALTVSLSAQTTWYVDPAGSNSNSGTAPGAASAFQTINHANSVAMTGDVIQLAAATFGPEQGIIVLGNKDVAVLGAGAGQTVIKANPSETILINRGFPGAPVPVDQRPIVLISGSGNVDFRGITFDGDFQVPPSGFLFGLIYRGGADGTVEDCVIRNCRDNPLTSSQGPAGVEVRGDGALDPCVVTFRNTEIHDFGKVGIVTYFNSTVDVSECTIRGMGAQEFGGPAQLGVQFSYDSRGSVRRSTFTDLYYNPQSYGATAILAFDTVGATAIDDNHIGNCEQGINAVQTGFSNSTLVIRENDIHNAEIAISLDNVVFASILNNKLQLRSSSLLQAAWDSSPNHQWLGNSYSTYSGTGPHPIPGGGGNSDPSPSNDVDLLAGPSVTTALPAGHVPVAMAVADFDGGTGDDFATFDQFAGLSVTVGINDGVGNFTTTNIPLPLVAASPVSIVSGEFDGAPGVDLAVLATSTLTTQDTVLVLANNGAGSFTPLTPALLTGFTIPTGMVSGDVSGGSASDLVVIDESGVAALLTNNGAGVFVQTSVPVTSSLPLRGVAIGQFGGSAAADIALLDGDATQGTLTIYQGDGAGGFTALPGASTLAAPKSLAADDFDGVDNDDLIGGFDGAVMVFENDGAASFRQSVYVADGPVTGVATGNLDWDTSPSATFGDAAAFYAGGNELLIYGDYRARAGFGDGGLMPAGAQPTAVAFGNADGDAFQDLFYADLSSSVVTRTDAAQARVDYYGFGCPGTGQRIPHLQPGGYPAPIQPNPLFAIELTNSAPFSVSLVLLSFAPSATLAPCLPQVDLLSLLNVLVGFNNSLGQVVIPLPLPGTPNAAGLELYVGGLTFDPAGAPQFGFNFSSSKGMKLRIGY